MGDAQLRAYTPCLELSGADLNRIAADCNMERPPAGPEEDQMVEHWVESLVAHELEEKKEYNIDRNPAGST